MFGFQFIQNTDWHGSFAYYKVKENKLIIARDHFGSKPLWIHKKGNNDGMKINKFFHRYTICH